MADAFVKQVIQNGPRNYIATYTCVFTLTSPISTYVAADPTSAGDMGWLIGGNTLYPDTNLKIWRLDYDMSASQGLEILWDATADQVALAINGQGSGCRDYKHQGGIYVPSGLAGATGKILFTTLGTPSAGDIISINMWLKKDIQG